MLAFLCVLLAAGASTTATYRLPTNVIPQHYTLDIVANLGDEGDEFAFKGRALIKVSVVAPTTNVTLHSKDLHIHEDKIRVNEGLQRVVGIHRDAEHDFVTLLLDAALPAEQLATLEIAFSGKLIDGLAGFYRSSYTTQNSKTRQYLAVTQFESTDARRAFPCFDEPHLKAKFLVSLGHSAKYTALSNMNELEREPMPDKDGWVWTRFAETVPMSTYLVAFMVSEFEHEVAPLEAAHGNLTFRVWARRDVLEQTRLAQSVGPRALRYFETYFNISYPLPKLDMVAVPDFSAGAMENWGLITYRETALLVDDAASTAASREAVTSTIAHELAHQWFGNLVTMRWWTDLWLNEGFATFMAAQAIDHLYPEWQHLVEESAENMADVFAFDALRSSHPVSVPVGNPREIAEIFDAIAYRKGAFLLRMMSHFLGEQTLRAGVRDYLLQHLYGSAEQDDLWQALTEAAHANRALPPHLTVKRIMDTWTLQTGYPVLDVRRDYAVGTVNVTQRRFLRDAVAGKAQPDAAAARWWVPLTYTDGAQLEFGDSRPKHFLADDGAPLDGIAGPRSADDWLLFNVQLAGLYRVNYDVRNWRLLAAALNSDDFGQLPAVNRFQLLSDAGALAWTGDLSYDVFFSLLRYVARERSYLPWKVAADVLRALNYQLRRSSAFGALRAHNRQLLAPVYGELGRLTRPAPEDDGSPQSVQRVKLQALVAQLACRAEVPACIADALQLFEAYARDPQANALPKNLRSVVTCNAVRNGGEDVWNLVWKHYLATNVASVKVAMLRDLACTKEPWLLRRFLEWSVDPSTGIRTQDFASIFTTVAYNQHGYTIAKDFLEEKLPFLSTFLVPSGKSLSRCLTSLADQMITQTELDWFANLNRTHAAHLRTAQQGVKQGLETIALNLQWQGAHGATIGKKLGYQKESRSA